MGFKKSLSRRKYRRVLNIAKKRSLGLWSAQKIYMKIVVAIDSLKGCLTSIEANRAAADGIRMVCPDAEVVQIPVSDGGEGFLDAFYAATGGQWIEVTARDPLMRPVTCKYLLQGKQAVIETAQASGLTLLSAHERNPMVATSYGTGQLVADAVRKGARHVIVALGGSGTSDAGIGMLRALIDAFASHGSLSGHSPYTPCLWDDVKELKHVSFTIASDVNNPLYGRNGAAYVFAPQKFAIQPEQTDLRLSHGAAHTQPKGIVASPKLIEELERRARKFAELSARHFGYDRSGMEGAGAAGGMGYAFLQYLNASYKPGIQLLLEEIGFNEAVKDADLVITGEGSADRQTLMGKLPMGILAQAGKSPVCLIAGKVSHAQQLLGAGFAHVLCINPQGISLKEAMQADVAKRNISRTVAALMAIQGLARRQAPLP